MKATKPLPPNYPRVLKTLGNHLKKKRLDFGLLQTDLALRFGVNVDTISKWENNKVTPNSRMMPKIIDFFGYDPKRYLDKDNNED